MRPFVAMMYGALYHPENSAPKGCVWTRQISVALNWVLAFLEHRHGDLIMRFTLDGYFRRGAKHSITVDASPYGLGAFLCIDDRPIAFFACRLTSTDYAVLGIKDTGDSRVQQASEAMAMLIALRLSLIHI